MNLPLDTQIESLLFWKGEPMSLKKIADILSKNESEVKSALGSLEERLENSGIKLVYTEDSVMLRTHEDMSEVIEKLNKDELQRDLSKAALETLTIILYRGPIKRSQIDYIRGVNSQFILRTLSIRGLIQKKTDPKDERALLYSPSFDLLSYLGVSKKEDLPEYENVNEDIENFMKETEADEIENGDKTSDASNLEENGGINQGE